MLVMSQRFGDFYLGWPGSILQLRQNMIKVDSKSWLLTCSSNITLSLPSCTGSTLKRELNFGNGYLSLLYFCQFLKLAVDCSSNAHSAIYRNLSPIVSYDKYHLLI